MISHNVAVALSPHTHTQAHTQTVIHIDGEAAAIGLPRHNVLRSEQIKSSASPGRSLWSYQLTSLCVRVCSRVCECV